MEILNKQFKSETIGILLLVSSILILIFTIISSIILIAFGLKSDVGLISLLPFSFLSLISLSLSILGIYVGIRYLKRNGLKKNISWGTILIVFGIFNIVYSTLTFIFSNLTGNIGGELKLVLAIFWGIISIPLGMALKNGVK